MSAKQLSHFLWVERYRPQSIKETLLPAKLRKYFLGLVEKKEIPNLLLASNSPGTGKSTTAKALCNDIGADFIYINNSMESGIDTLRSNISKFASTKSMHGGPKIVILDESDNSSPAFQAALRGFTEEFSNSCRFILTCNYISKIIEPLRSRCECVDFGFMVKEIQEEMKPKIVKRLSLILTAEKIQFDPATIAKLVDTYYPDIRQMLKLLNQFTKTMEESEVLNDSIFNVQMINSELYDFILQNKFTKAREYIINHNYNFDELYSNFYREFIPLIERKEKWPQITIILAQYQHMNSFVADKELNFSACLWEILGAIQS